MRGEDPEKGKTLSEVTLREGETQDSLLKRFNTAVQKSGLLREVKRKRFFESPVYILGLNLLMGTLVSGACKLLSSQSTVNGAF